jgi:hypothetical protein
MAPFEELMRRNYGYAEAADFDAFADANSALLDKRC